MGNQNTISCCQLTQQFSKTWLLWLNANGLEDWPKHLLKNNEQRISAWWFQPLWKILVSWDYEIPNMESHKIHVPNHKKSSEIAGGTDSSNWVPRITWCESAYARYALHLETRQDRSEGVQGKRLKYVKMSKADNGPDFLLDCQWYFYQCSCSVCKWFTNMFCWPFLIISDFIAQLSFCIIWLKLGLLDLGW